MTATFPNGIASFTSKVDNQDVNYAADINRLQDEVTAIETVLGVLLNEFSDLSTDVANDDVVERIKFKDLNERLKYIQNGYHIRSAQLSGSNWLTSPSDVQTDPGLVLAMDKPSLAHDPYGMWNGKGLTLAKAGFWLIHGFVRFDVGDTRPHPQSGDNANWNKLNNGVFQASIDDGSGFRVGADRKQVAADGNYWPNVFLNPMRLQWFDKGTKIKLRASQNSGQNQHIFNATLGAVWFRSPAPTGITSVGPIEHWPLG